MNAESFKNLIVTRRKLGKSIIREFENYVANKCGEETILFFNRNTSIVNGYEEITIGCMDKDCYHPHYFNCAVFAVDKNYLYTRICDNEFVEDYVFPESEDDLLNGNNTAMINFSCVDLDDIGNLIDAIEKWCNK